MKTRGSAIAFLLVTCLLVNTCRAGSDWQKEVALEAVAGSDWAETFYGFSAAFSNDFSQQRSAPLPLFHADPIDACQPIAGNLSLSGRAVLAVRGTCSFATKAENVQQAGAALLIVYNNEPGVLAMDGNLSSSHLQAMSISDEDGKALLAHGDGKVNVTTRLLPPENRSLDLGVVVIFLLAVGILSGGAVWAGFDHKVERGLVRLSIPGQGQSGGGAPATPQEPSLEVQFLTWKEAVGFVVTASLSLVVLFFFLNHIFALILIVLFCLAAAQSLALAFSDLAYAALPAWRATTLEVPLFGRCLALSVATAPIACAITLAWAIFQDSPVGWVLQDLMGASLMLLIMRQFRLPSIKVACVLLPLCFVYDIFWVFIQPMLTSGPSVMVQVATGGSQHERMPMMVVVPRAGGAGEWGMGFGDIVLPGLLVVYTRCFDIDHGRESLHRSYFAPTVAGYAVGLLATFAALVLRLGGQGGQPALLYLVPGTLGTVAALAWWRGDLQEMWQGPEDDAEAKAKTSDEEDEEVGLPRPRPASEAGSEAGAGDEAEWGDGGPAVPETQSLLHNS